MLYEVITRSLKIALFALNRQSEKVSVENILPLLISEALLGQTLTASELHAQLPIQDQGKVVAALSHMETQLQVLNSGGQYS